METALSTSIVGIVSGLVSGGGVALLNHFLTHRRTQAEIEKIQAEAAKVRAETERIVAEVKNTSASINYRATEVSQQTVNEQILFDGRQRIEGFDVEGREGHFWSGYGADAKPSSPMGRGELSIEEGGILNIRRSNTEGRFEVSLRSYLYKGKQSQVIPHDELISGERKLRVSCEVKIVGAEHHLRFMVRVPNMGTKLSGVRLDERLVTFKSAEWIRCDVFLLALPDEDSILRIDDEYAAAAPSSVQIRNLVLAQRN